MAPAPRSPVTAVRILDEFGGLGEGAVVVQNGANSAVGRAIIQVAKARGTPVAGPAEGVLPHQAHLAQTIILPSLMTPWVKSSLASFCSGRAALLIHGWTGAYGAGNRTVNVVRERPELGALRAELMCAPASSWRRR